MDQELKKERDKVPFNIEELTNWFYGGADKVKEKRFLENLFYSDNKNDINTSYSSRTKKYEEAVKSVGMVLKKLKQINQGQYGENIYENILGGTKHLIEKRNPLSAHFDMFIPFIKSMGTKEQHNEWLPRALKCEILGTYAHIELGHGSNIHAFETTATYDLISKDFILNSPTLSSYKRWSACDYAANYAFIMAQLFINGKNFGVHAFIVQLRHEVTHQLLVGIDIGGIDSKKGFNTVNNEFLAMRNVRIPRKNMMMKISEVMENGDYIMHNDSLLIYETMTMIKIGIINEFQIFLMKAVVIEIRYAMIRCIRCKGPTQSNEFSQKIIDHVPQQYKVFSIMTKVIVMKVTANLLQNMHDEILKQIENGNLSRLVELHNLSCCLKAICTNDAAIRVDFEDINKTIYPAQIYEEENTVLLLQTANYLLECWSQLLNGLKLPPTIAYLRNHIYCNEKTKESFDSSPRGILRALESTAAAKIALAYKHVEEKKKHHSEKEARNLCSLELVKISELHGRLFLIQTAVRELEKASKQSSAQLSYIFKDILELYTVTVAKQFLSDILQHIKVSSASIEKLEGRLVAVLKRIRQYAIGIADACDFSDDVLDSTFGSYDSNITKFSLSQDWANVNLEQYLKPFMKSSL